MGGTVAVTLRKSDGTEYRMDRWTNSMSWGICNLKMLQGDEQHIASYLEQWLIMKDDYERNKESGVFEQPMTDCYFPSEGLAPCGYGLVVVDHINKVILDLQGYTSFDSINVASVSLELPRDMPADNMLRFDPDGDALRFKEFLAAGRIKGVTTRESYNEGREYDELNMTFDQVILRLMGYEKARSWFQFIVDLGEWSYEKFNECDPQALRDYRARLLELNFTISDEENKVWDDLITEYEEDYGEEDA